VGSAAELATIPAERVRGAARATLIADTERRERGAPKR
jgi:hypothetical protein